MIERIDHTDNTEERIKYPKLKQKVFDDRRPHLGMKMFCVNQKTGKASVVKIKTSSIPIEMKPANDLMAVSQNQLPRTEVRSEVHVDKWDWFCWAINAKNAEKKYQQKLKEMGYR